MIRPSLDELARDWLLMPAPLADDADVAAFDPQAAVAMVAQVEAKWARLPSSRAALAPWRFQDFAVRPGMGAAEALFWLRVAAGVDRHRAIFSVEDASRPAPWRFHAQDALARYPEASPSRSELEALVVAALRHGHEAVGAWLLPLIGLRQVIEWHLSGKLRELAVRSGAASYFFWELMGCRLPNLVRQSEWRTALQALEEHLDPKDWYAREEVPWGSGGHRRVRPAWQMAVSLGHTEALRALVKGWPDDVWASPEWYGESGLALIFGVRDPDFTLRQLTRLKLSPQDTGVWLLHTQDRLLGPVVEKARRANSKAEAEEIVAYLGEVKSDRVIRSLLLLGESSGPVKAAASHWLAAHPERVLRACVGIVAEGGAQAQMAGAHLRAAWAGGGRAEVERLALAASSGRPAELVAEWARQESRELRAGEWPLPARAGATKSLPEWVRPETLEPLVREGRRLGLDGVGALLTELRNEGAGGVLARWVREQCSAESREAFWQGLIVAWCLAGSGKKDNWCMHAAVALRGPETAKNLARFIGTWPTESQHLKAALGLEALRAMGDAPALQALIDIAQRTRFAGLRGRAEDCVFEIARELGLTTEELADTSVPACGLDAEGRLTLDFGTRRFTAGLGRGAELVLRTEDGRRLKALPKPGVADDANQAARATVVWKGFRKTLVDTVKTQTRRLEHALTTGRLWRAMNFERYVAAHPVMRRLAETLVWAEFDSEGLARDFFTVRGSDGAPVSAEGEVRGAFATSDRLIGLAHPLHFPETELARWRAWFAAAGAQVVPQLERETETVPTSDADAVLVAEFSGRKIAGVTLRRRMDALGWRRGVPVEAGMFYEYAQPFSAAEVTVVVETDGQPVVTGYEDGEVTVRRVFFVAELYEPVEYAKHEHALALGLVDGVAYSEALRCIRQALRPPARATGDEPAEG